MLDFYLGVNNSLNNDKRGGGEVIHLPATPPKFNVSSPQSSETFETADYGYIRIIGNPELKTISWESIFPVHDYPFRRDYSLKGQEYADRLEKWRREKLPVRFIITSSGYADIGINIAVQIEKFDYSVEANGDLSYNIELAEVNLQSDVQEGLTVSQYEEISTRLDAIESRVSSIEDKMIYNYMDDNMPSWAKSTIQKLMDKGYINGTVDNELGLTDEMLRLLVINDRAGCYGD